MCASVDAFMDAGNDMYTDASHVYIERFLRLIPDINVYILYKTYDAL